MDRGRVGEDRGSKETDGCPLTEMVRSCLLVFLLVEQMPMGKRFSPHNLQ
jgi:hypothetical protein